MNKRKKERHPFPSVSPFRKNDEIDQNFIKDIIARVGVTVNSNLNIF